jgi:DNA-binding CsgD family transcriptional regulator
MNSRCIGRLSNDKRCWGFATSRGIYCEAHQPPLEESNPDDVHLTEREQQVLALTVAGFSIPEISGQLRHSERTAKFYSDSLRHKFGVGKRRELIRVGRAYFRTAQS